MTLNSVITLEENPSSLYLKITSLILKILDNIIKNPFNHSYRHINLSNDQVSNTLLSGIGAMECLFELGFQEGDYSLILPFNANLNELVEHRNEIAYRRNKYLDRISESGHLPQQTSEISINPILEKIFYFYNFVLAYEEPDLQKIARKCIPLESLEIAAERKMRQIQLLTKLKQNEEDVSIQELLIMELVLWFKNDFFSWVDSPVCAQCGGPTKFLKISNKASDIAESTRTELYACEGCGGFTTPFHRYNDPRKLLQTRKGRCGEWASCFTLFCRCLGYDARLSYDVTDHLWTEVYILSKTPHWLHVDPCEGIVDAPMMYECGWGKKLSHILSFSVEGVQDVTWRYSMQSPEELMESRKVSGLHEEDLLATILNVRQNRFKAFSVPKQKYLIRRTAIELAEFLWMPGINRSQVKEEEKRGRISGSLAWRLTRSELGSDLEPSQQYIWQLSENEEDAEEFIIKYSSALDKYVRVVGNNTTEIKGWKSGLYENSSIFRKEEKDWKMAYLARTEGTEQGSIKLKFDISSSGLAIKSISVYCKSDVFENGKVICILCGEDTCTRIPTGNNVRSFITNDLEGAKTFTLEAKLSGGNGDVAWQHAQLFRQSLQDTVHFPLEIRVQLKNCSLKQ